MDNIPPYFIVVIVILCLIASFVFTAAENALTNCDIYHFKVKAEDGNNTAKFIYKLANKFDDSLVTVLVGNNASQALLSNVAAIFFLSMSNNFKWPDGIESIISTIVVTLVLYLFTDFLPKIISKAYPNQTIKFVVYPVYFFYILFFPIIIIFRGFLKIIKKITKNKEDLSITKEEFIDKADEADNQVLEEDEKQILNRAFYFGQISVNQVLTPKNKIFSLNIDELTTAKLNKILLSINYSRIPIYEDSPDNIIGILTIRTYFKEYIKDNHLDIRGVLIEPIRVKETDKVDDIFSLFNDEKTHIAFVYDDKECFIGMITMEDVLEELVGDINEKQTTSIEIKGVSKNG